MKLSCNLCDYYFGETELSLEDELRIHQEESHPDKKAYGIWIEF